MLSNSSSDQLFPFRTDRESPAISGEVAPKVGTKAAPSRAAAIPQCRQFHFLVLLVLLADRRPRRFVHCEDRHLALPGPGRAVFVFGRETPAPVEVADLDANLPVRSRHGGRAALQLAPLDGVKPHPRSGRFPEHRLDGRLDAFRVDEHAQGGSRAAPSSCRPESCTHPWLRARAAGRTGSRTPRGSCRRCWPR